MRTTLRTAIGLAAAAALAQVGAAQPGFSLLPVLAGGGENSANAISHNGVWVAGSSVSSLAPWPEQESFRWSLAVGAQSLGAFNGDYRSSGTGISADGATVVGLISTNRAFRWTPTTGKEFIGTPPGYTNSHATGVSADGTVLCGYSMGVTQDAAFIWTTASGFTMVPGFVGSRANGISADGQIVMGRGDGRAFRWVVGTPNPQLIGPFPGTVTSTIGQSISADGRIVGVLTDLQTSRTPAVWTEKYEFTVLPRLSQYPNCNVNAVSLDGRIVVGDCAGHLGLGPAVMWTGPGPQGPYQVHNLNLYLPSVGIQLPPNSSLIRATSISADGRVLVGSANVSSATRAFRLEFCYANCDRSTTSPYLNVDDFTCFINEFAAGMAYPHHLQLYHYANCDKSTVAPVLNVDDLTCFINRFAQGCPSP